MWAETLHKLNHSVTPQKAAQQWNADKNSIQLINNGINVVYRFEVKGEGKYLRITHSKIRSKNELESAIDYQKHLFTNGASVCQPIPSQSGQYIEEVQQDDLIFLTHVADEVPGTVVEFKPNDEIFYHRWGQSLGKLHHAQQSYHPSEQFHFKSWKDLWLETKSYLDKEKDDIQIVFNEIDDWTKILTPDHQFGLIHGDHRTGNVLYDGKQVYIIDFDEPVHHWLTADLVNPFLEFAGQRFSTWQQKFNWYLEGYQSVFPVDRDLHANLHWFARMKSLSIYLWCKNNWFEPEAPGGKSREQWLNELLQMTLKPIFSF